MQLKYVTSLAEKLGKERFDAEVGDAHVRSAAVAGVGTELRGGKP